MNLFDPIIIKKIVNLSKQVTNEFQQKGIAIPVKNDDGSITVGNFSIVKIDNFYYIQGSNKENIISKINLPQTAILLANGLALGKFFDTNLYQKDQNYGYALFEEILYSARSKRKNIDKNWFYSIKLNDAKTKKEFYKKTITGSFEKLYQNI